MSQLFYIIGASGAGKDTLMNYARQNINTAEKVIFAHRYITRAPFTGNENHIHLTPDEFNLRMNAGLFALYWESHGYFYGIGSEINNWILKGFNVVVNGSRQYLPTATRLFPDITAVMIEASPESIIARLAGRGRESYADIEKRIARTNEITTDLKDCIKIQNDYTIETAGNALINIISASNKQYI